MATKVNGRPKPSLGSERLTVGTANLPEPEIRSIDDIPLGSGLERFDLFDWYGLNKLLGPDRAAVLKCSPEEALRLRGDGERFVNTDERKLGFRYDVVERELWIWYWPNGPFDEAAECV